MDYLIANLIFLILDIIILYFITNKLMGLNNSSLLKAFIIALVVFLLNFILPVLIGILVGNSEGFHTELFSSILRYLALIPGLVIIKITYQMSWRQFGTYFLINFVIGIIKGYVLIPVIFKLVY